MPLTDEQKDRLRPILTEIKIALSMNRQPKLRLYEAVIWTAGCPIAKDMILEIIDEIDKTLSPGIKKMAVANLVARLIQMKESGWGAPEHIPCLDDIIQAVISKAKQLFPNEDLKFNTDEVEQILERF